MKNADVAKGEAYAWSRYKPRPGDPLAKVVALGPALTTGRSAITGQMIEFAEDHDPRWGAGIPKGTIRTVPARELVGPWEEFAAKEDALARLRAEGARLVEEILSTLEVLGLGDNPRPHVFATPTMGDVKVTVSFWSAAHAQAFSDALAFAANGKG